MSRIFDDEKKLNKLEKFLRDLTRSLLSRALEGLLQDKARIERKLGIVNPQLESFERTWDDEDEEEDNDDEQEEEEMEELNLNFNQEQRKESIHPNLNQMFEDKEEKEEETEMTEGLSYVELVKLHVSKYIKEANIWSKKSLVDSTVREWEEKLRPILEEQESHEEFDIHECGQRIVENLDLAQKKSFIPFENAMSGGKAMEKYDLCRMFLATLQLANNGNVELQHESNFSPLEVKLLDRKLADKKMYDQEF